MRNILAILSCLLTLSLIGQTRRFNAEAREILSAKDATSEIQHRTISDEPFNIIQQSPDELQAIFLAHLKKEAKKRPDELTVSSTLSTLAELAVKFWKGTVYSDKKKWSKLSKHFKRASNRTVSKFNILDEHSFRLTLVNDLNKPFYYDQQGSKGGLNLYFGKKPKNQKEREEMEQIPLPYFTQTELVDQFIHELKRKGVYRNVQNGVYASVGLHLEIDQNSLYKNRLPTARVVVVFGARRLRNIRVKYPPKETE